MRQVEKCVDDNSPFAKMRPPLWLARESVRSAMIDAASLASLRNSACLSPRRGDRIDGLIQKLSLCIKATMLASHAHATRTLPPHCVRVAHDRAAQTPITQSRPSPTGLYCFTPRRFQRLLLPLLPQPYLAYATQRHRTRAGARDH